MRRVIIVGGVAGGASAATRLRRLDESAQITIFERGSDVSFANCGMPYFIGNQIRDRQKLLVTTPQRLKERFNIDVNCHHQVLSIDRLGKTIAVKNLLDGSTRQESYTHLILAPGAAPITPPIAGMTLPGVFCLRSLTDMDKICAAIDQGARHAVVIGAGFIGLEMVENLVKRGLGVTLLQLTNQVLAPFDPEMVTVLHRVLRDRGVDLRLGTTATAITKGGRTRLGVTLRDGTTIDTDLVVVGVGVRPESQLARDAGLAVGARGGICVNAACQTSDPAIYAVGDVIETVDAIFGRPTQIPLAGIANRQGRIAATHVVTGFGSFSGALGTAIVKMFDHVAAITGANETTLKQQGTDYRVAVVHPAHHATYYPGAESMTIKVTFEYPSGRLLGGQVVGGAGVDKRIDVLAMALQAKMTVFDLENAELAYAPQFGSAKDPINMVGFVAAGLLRGEHPQWSANTFFSNPESRAVIDVRTPEEFAEGALPGARNIPIDEMRSRLAELEPGRPLLVYCRVGQRGYLATRILLQQGYNVVNLSGGYLSYVSATEVAPQMA